MTKLVHCVFGYGLFLVTLISTFQNSKKENTRNCRLIRFIPISRKIMTQTLLKAISQHIKNKKVVQSRQHGFTKDKLCLTNLFAFCDELVGSVDKDIAMDIG